MPPRPPKMPPRRPQDAPRRLHDAILVDFLCKTWSRLCRNEPGKEKNYVAPNLMIPIIHSVFRPPRAQRAVRRRALRAPCALRALSGPWALRAHGPFGPMGRRRASRAVRASRAQAHVISLRFGALSWAGPNPIWAWPNSIWLDRTLSERF